jgi:hypothetical protein
MSELNQTQTSSDPEAQAGFEVPSIEQRENIIFSEERPVQTHEVFAAQSTYKDDLAHQLSMPEKPWHTSQLIQRPIRVGTYSWATTGALWTTNNKLDIPRSFYGLNYFLVNVLSMFAFMRADFVVRIQLNSTKFHCGKMLAFFVPMGCRTIDVTKITTDRGVSIPNAMVLPHAWLDASESTVAEIRIPFRHINTFLANYQNTSGVSSMTTLGELYFSIFNPLISSTSSTSTVDYTVWYYADTPTLHVPIFPYTLPNPTFANSDHTGLKRAIPAEAQMDVAKDIVSGASSLSRGDYKGAADSAIRVGLKGLQLASNLDKPNVEKAVNCFTFPGFTHGTGVSSVMRLSLSPFSKTVHSPELVGNAADEMDLKKLVKIPSCIAQLGWNVSAGVGTVLSYWRVHPNVFWYVNKTAGTTDYISYSNLGYLSSKFMFWRGSITYHFSFATTQFHTGRLLVAFIPNYTVPGSPPSLDQLVNMPSMIFDIQKNKEFTFTVPYYSQTPWKRMPPVPDDVQNGFAHATELGDVLGTIAVSVLNPLVAPLTVASNIVINVFMSGGDDFELMAPGRNNPEMPTQPWFGPSSFVQPDILQLSRFHMRRSAEPAEPQGDDQPATGQPDNETYIFSKTSNVVTRGTSGFVIEADSLYGGESFMDLRNILKRTTLQGTFSVTTTYNSNVPLVSFNITPIFEMYNQPSGPTTAFYSTSLLSHYVNAFAFWRGSLQQRLVTITNKNANILSAIRHRPAFYETDNSYHVSTTVPLHKEDFNYANCLENFSHKTCVDVEIPYYTRYVQLLTSSNVAGEQPTTLGSLAMNIFTTNNMDSSVSSNLNFLHFAAAGDDFICSYYLGPMTWTVPYGVFPNS